MDLEGFSPWQADSGEEPLGALHLDLSEHTNCLEIDDSLQGIERAMHIIKHGSTSQLSSVALTFRSIFDETFDTRKYETVAECIQVTFEAVVEVLIPPRKEKSTVVKFFAISVKKVLTDGIVDGNFVYDTILPGLSKLLECYPTDPLAKTALVDSFVAALLQENTYGKFTAPRKIIERRVLPFLLEEHLVVGTPVVCRFMAVAVLGAIARAKMLPPKVMEDYVLEAVGLACCDEDASIRCYACSMLPVVCEAIHQKPSSSTLGKLVYELLLDMDMAVRDEAVKAAVHTIHMFPPRFRREKVFSQFQALTEISFTDKRFLNSFPSVLPLLLEYLAKDQVNFSLFGSYLLRWYLSLASSDVEEHRYLCAFNYPFVVHIHGSVGETYDKYAFHNTTFEKLSRDKSCKVRRTIACQLHELMRMLVKPATRKLLFTAFKRFLADEDREVQSCVIKNLECILKFAPPDSHENRSMLLKTILKHETAIETQWRNQQIFISSFLCCLPHFDHVDIYSWCPPILHNYMIKGSQPVQQHASDVLVLLSRKCMNGRHRLDLFENCKARYFQHESFVHRRAFLLLCNSWQRLSSYAFFKWQIWASLEVVAHDANPAMRRMALKIILGVVQKAIANTDLCLVEKMKMIVFKARQKDECRLVSDFACTILKRILENNENRKDFMATIIQEDSALNQEESVMDNTMRVFVVTSATDATNGSLPTSVSMSKQVHPKQIHPKGSIQCSFPTLHSRKVNGNNLSMVPLKSLPGSKSPRKMHNFVPASEPQYFEKSDVGEARRAFLSAHPPKSMVPSAPNSPKPADKISQIREQNFTMPSSERRVGPSTN